MKKPDRKRHLRNLLINPAFQGAVILYSLILSFVVLLAQFVALKLFFKKYLREGDLIGLNHEHPFFKFIAEQERYMGQVFIVLAIVLVIVNVMAGLLLSHRIAGPIHRLKGFFRGLQKKEVRPLSFRKNDFFQDVPPVVNEALTRFEQSE